MRPRASQEGLAKRLVRNRPRRTSFVTCVLMLLLVLLASGLPTATHIAYAAPAGFRLPFVGGYNITTGPGCAPNHTDGVNAEAIDFATPSTVSVVAAQSGYAWYWWDSLGGGTTVFITSEGGYESRYAHLSQIILNLPGPSRTKPANAVWVNKGDAIAKPGDSGIAYGVHLHFSVTKDGVNQNIRDLPGISQPFPNCGTKGWAVGPAVENPPPPDTVAPTIELALPHNNDAFDNSITVVADVSDNLSGINRVEFYLTVGGELTGRTDTNGSDGWGYTFDVSGKPEQGGIQVDAWAYDNVGNSKHSNVITGLRIDRAQPQLASDISVSPSSFWSGGSINFTFTLRNPGQADFDAESVYVAVSSPSSGPMRLNAQPQVIPAGQSRSFVASLSLPTNDPGWWLVTKLINVKRRGGAEYLINQGSFVFPAEFYVNPYDSSPPSVSLTAPGDNYFYTYEILATANASDPESGIKKVEFHFKLDGQWQLMWVDDTPADGFSYHFPGNSYGPQSDLWILAWAENGSGARQQSGAAMHITNIDTQAPQVSISGPTPGQSFSGDYIDVQATASDNVGVDHVTFYLGYPGGLISMTDANGSDGWSARLSIRDLPNMTGMYVNAHAYDAKNNDGASGAISNLSISRPCPCFENVKSGQGYDNIIQVALRTPSPANWVNLYLTPQGQGYRGRSMVLWGDLVWRTSWDVSDLPEGTRMMMDGWIGYPSGQQQTPVFTDLVIDRSNPSMHLTGPGDGATFNNTVTVTASASDQYSGVDKVVFYFAWPGNSLPEITDTDGSNGWQATFDTSALGPGSYRLDAWVYDKVGHASHSPEVWWITKN